MVVCDSTVELNASVGDTDNTTKELRSSEVEKFAGHEKETFILEIGRSPDDGSEIYSGEDFLW